MTVTRIILVVAALAAGGTLAPGAGAAPLSKRSQLDRDAPLEVVRAEKRGPRACRQPRPCSRVVLQDGKRKRALSSFGQGSPNRTFAWSVASLQTVDLTGDGIAEVVYTLRTVGGTGSSPTLMAVVSWDGRRARKLFLLENGRAPEPGWKYVITARGTITSGADGFPEIETSEGMYTETDATCCPSAIRRQRWRWNGTVIAPVAGTKEIDRSP